MIKTALLVLSVGLVVWLTELLTLITVRMYQVRHEYWHWFNSDVSWERKRILALILGFWLLLSYVILQISDDIFAHDVALYVFGGVVGVLMLLWWLFQSVFRTSSTKIWLLSVIAGIAVGIGTVFFD